MICACRERAKEEQCNVREAESYRIYPKSFQYCPRAEPEDGIENG